MTGRWLLDNRGLSLVFDRADFEQGVRRALEWQADFDRQVAIYRQRYAELPRWRQLVYRWFSLGLGIEATGYIKTKILGAPLPLSEGVSEPSVR